VSVASRSWSMAAGGVGGKTPRKNTTSLVPIDGIVQDIRIRDRRAVSDQYNSHSEGLTMRRILISQSVGVKRLTAPLSDSLKVCSVASGSNDTSDRDGLGPPKTSPSQEISQVNALFRPTRDALLPPHPPYFSFVLVTFFTY
jgi:hypothetical protein